MKCSMLVLSVCLASMSSHAQSPALSPSQTLQRQAAQAQALYGKHAYADAAAILEKLSADPQVTALSDWPDVLYSLACLQALDGKPAQALLTLKQFVDLGPTVSVDHIRKDSDLTSLHSDPQFQELLARMATAEALWNDDPAIATPYTTVLTEDEKVAGLSKFWSEARFNFSFFSRLPDLDWDREYMDYLPQVRAAQTTADYYGVMMRFAASLHDGHTGVFPPKALYGTFSHDVGFGTQLVEDKVLVTEIYDPAVRALGLSVGTEIVTIDGQPVRDYAKSVVSPYVNGFTPQDRSNRTYGYDLLAGLDVAPIKLTVREENGETKSISVLRHCEPSSKCAWPANDSKFKMLPGNIAYLVVNSFNDDLGAKTMRDSFTALSQSKALIIDVRKNGGGSTSNGYAY